MRHGLVVLPGVLLALAGCNAIANIHDGKPRDGPPCGTLSDCTVEEPECRQALGCQDGRCVFEDAPAGKALSAQTPGDCGEIQCDGAGRQRLSIDLTDIPDDGNPCTLDACNGSEPTHQLMQELPCYT